MTTIPHHMAGPGSPPSDHSISAQLRDRPYPQVIDLSNSPGAEQPPREVAPGLWRTNLPRQPLMVGHVRDINEQTSPVLTDGELIDSAAPPFIAPCTQCSPAAYISPGPVFIWLVIEHDPCCEIWADIQALRIRR